MTKKGTEVMASGNLFHWEHASTGSRGGVTGQFARDPSDADVSEARAFAQALVPSGAIAAITAGYAHAQDVKSLMDDFLFGGQRN